MKKLEYVYIGRKLKSSRGVQGRYGYEEMTVSGFERGGKFTFVIEREGQNGRDKLQTGDVREVLEEIRGFNPKATSWKLSKKEKVVKQQKA